MTQELQPEEIGQFRPNTNFRHDIVVSPNMLGLVEVDKTKGEPTDDEFSYALANLKDSIDNKIKKLIVNTQAVQTE